MNAQNAAKIWLENVRQSMVVLGKLAATISQITPKASSVPSASPQVFFGARPGHFAGSSEETDATSTPAQPDNGTK